MKTIESDAELPKYLNTRTKQVRKAKRLAQSFLREPAVKVRTPRFQGFFSRTIIVTMESGQECVIQFRVEPINIDDFKSARRLLGEVVPDIEKLTDAVLEKDGIQPYYMTLIPGKTWRETSNSEVDVVALRSLGRILSRGYVAGNSTAVVDKIIIPKLKSLQDSTDDRVKPFQPHIERLINDAAQLKRLPLFISHADLNRMNILVDENGEVAGIVDWEGASQLPFGMGFRRIHDLAGEFDRGEFRMPPSFEAAERGFWSEVFDGVPIAVRKALNNKLQAVQLSIIIGMLLEDLDSEHGFNPVALKALPKFLTYRIPGLRGKEPPYAE